MTTSIAPLIKRNIFASEEDAIQELVREYVLRQLEILQIEIHQFERKYGMNFQQFNQYLHERTLLLENRTLPTVQLQTLNAAIMQEEDDCLDWKAALEMLENWLDLRKEVGG